MPDIDNELLAIKGLGWRKASRDNRSYMTGDWLPWIETRGCGRKALPSFAKDPAACMELIRRLSSEFCVIVEPFNDDYRVRLETYGESVYTADGSTLESAIAAAFTAYLRETK